jgi:hypothetical protein
MKCAIDSPLKPYHRALWSSSQGYPSMFPSNQRQAWMESRPFPAAWEILTASYLLTKLMTELSGN